MNTYWDLSEAERAALSSEDVQRYVDAELMLKGVLKVKPLVLEPVPVAPAPTHPVWSVRAGSRHYRTDLGVVFTTFEAARAFMALKPVQLGNEWMGGGDSASFVRDIESDDYEIVEIQVFTEAEKNAVKADLQRASAIKAANETRATEYASAIKAQDDALKGLWEDWNACRERDAKLREVADTFADYKRTAGDDETAAKFLAKVYSPDVIAEAAARFGFSAGTQAAAE